MLEFDSETARILDDGYQGADVTRRRLANVAALAPRPGESVADVGCGPGLLAIDLSRAVGAGGTVYAIDPSAEMRATTEGRCAKRGNVRVLDGTADTMPLEDDALDGAVSLQVFEYLEDVPAALAEMRRVLRPGGRLVIGDLHWDSHIWHTDDYALMARMLRIWDRHMVWRRLPAYLPPMLRDAGFDVETVTPVICQDTEFRADGLARLMIHLISGYARQHELADDADVNAWADEQERLAREGRFFFSITHYVISARLRP